MSNRRMWGSLATMPWLYTVWMSNRRTDQRDAKHLLRLNTHTVSNPQNDRRRTPMLRFDTAVGASRKAGPGPYSPHNGRSSPKKGIHCPHKGRSSPKKGIPAGTLGGT